MKSSEGLRWNSSEVEEGGGEAMMPIICRIVLIIPLNMDMDMAVFTRIMHNTPSDGAGRLDRPILTLKKSLK